ncbi:hypothetical protein FNV43_RR02264 [Rhamnella rubrinervis]|uniref:Sulfotransferase n=1 Tax=Rhamnella rubrinervis TaxID=2594499 RepID=A0A8K0HR61_9ROSA|nr:hypothetical protein FNV43_RR02264 [Rhamnella rubrinervis]
MVKEQNSKSCSSIKEEDHEELNKETLEKQLQALPRENGWDGASLYLYKGFWCPSFAIRGVISSQTHFKAHEADIVLATIPKSATTWLKALIFSIVNRNRYKPEDNPLLKASPHDLVRFLEIDHYLNGAPDQNLDQLPQPRIFATHLPYASLPPSIKESKCRIVYACRNPLDNFVSFWHFVQMLEREDMQNILPIDEAYEKYCHGYYGYGPFWDHILGFWNMSLKEPEKVLFMKYEDLKGDVITQLKMLANFLGFSFTVEEEEGGTIEEIANLCSFENLKNLEANQKSSRRNNFGAPMNSFFRKGEVGDYVNHLTPSMVENMKKLIEEKLAGSDLIFEASSIIPKK